MDNNKLRQIIARQNEQLEDRATEQAREIIKAIAECQQAKIDADKEIEELRAKLKTLTVQQIDETSILGG